MQQTPLHCFVRASSGRTCHLHHLPCTSGKKLLPVRELHNNTKNVSEVVHHFGATVIFWTWINCLDCTARFSEKNPKGEVSSATAPAAWISPMSMKDSGTNLTVCEDDILWVYDPWPSLRLSRHGGSMLAAHSWMREGVNDSWLYSLALSARPAVY